jgi:hypothetical protein
MPHEILAWQGRKVRSSKYLNNMIEQDHRGVKLRLRPIFGFKDFDHAATTIAGVELLTRIRKGQFALGVCTFKAKLCLEPGTRCSPLESLRASRNCRAQILQFAPEPAC